jgi:hypothetical protein
MSLQDPAQPPTAPKWQRMPSRLRLELEAEVAAHLPRFGSRHRELIRDDSRFVAWTGTHLGHRGEKYFDRVVNQVRSANARRDRLKRHRPKAQESASIHEAETPPTAPLAASFGNGGAPSFAELMADYADQRRTIRLEQRSCFEADGLRDPKYHAALRRELREVNKAILEVSGQYQGNLRQAELRKAMFQRIGDEFISEPERGDKLMSDLNRLVEQLTGMGGTPGTRE